MNKLDEFMYISAAYTVYTCTLHAYSNLDRGLNSGIVSFNGFFLKPIIHIFDYYLNFML